jgi:hypothetical protein
MHVKKLIRATGKVEYFINGERASFWRALPYVAVGEVAAIILALPARAYKAAYGKWPSWYSYEIEEI